jgi:hypothetical protein
VGGRERGPLPGHACPRRFNRETTILGGRPVLNEDLVNLPNWLLLKLRIEAEEAIRLDNLEVLSYRHSCDIRNAVVEREIQFRDRAGRETTLRSRRFVSMAAGETTTESTTVSTSVNQLNFDALYLSHFASCGVSSASPAAAPWAAGWRSAVDAGAVLAGCLDGCRVWASGEGPLGVPPRWLPVARGLLTRSAGYVRARRAQLRKIQNLRLGVVVSGSAAWM